MYFKMCNMDFLRGCFGPDKDLDLVKIFEL